MKFVWQQRTTGDLQAATLLTDLASALADQGRLAAATENIIAAATIIERRFFQVQRSFGRRDHRIALEETELAERALGLLWSIPQTADARLATLESALKLAQVLAGSKAAKAVTQMTARVAAGNGPEFRAGADLQRLEQARDALAQDLALLRSEQNSKRTQEVAATSAELRRIDEQVTALTEELFNHAPRYFQLVSPNSMSSGEIASTIGPQDALVFFVTGKSELFAWLITPAGQPKWVRIEAGNNSLSDKVAALRCGLDEEEWVAELKASRCVRLLGIPEAPNSSNPLPFHLGFAYELYRTLFGELEDDIKGKRLLLVLSGPLTSLPFQVLVTKQHETKLPTTFKEYRDIAWLARSNGLTVLPAVSTLQALREHGKKRVQAPLDYIGFGNPVLKGDAGCRVARVANATCPALEASTGPQAVGPLKPPRATRGRGGRRSPDPKTLLGSPSAAALLEKVKAQCPLPDTSFEIECVSQRFNEQSRAIRLGAQASELEIKKLSRDGVLQRYRFVHFATHGLLAGDVETMSNRKGEPALIMTPPERFENDRNDGLLTASEVAQLELNADWVVLSACNTAAGDNIGAEALSGLARAFFYAQARGLLVSHWPVYSDAAVRLTARAFAELERNPKAGRAEALQISMIELMQDHSDEDNGHPAVWAPFVVVGDPGR